MQENHNADGTATSILKECKEESEDKVYGIINCSLKSARLPQDWKKATIMPIHIEETRKTQQQVSILNKFHNQNWNMLWYYCHPEKKGLISIQTTK